MVDLSVAMVMSVCVMGSGAEVEVGGANLMILWAGERAREGRSRERYVRRILASV